MRIQCCVTPIGSLELLQLAQLAVKNQRQILNVIERDFVHSPIKFCHLFINTFCGLFSRRVRKVTTTKKFFYFYLLVMMTNSCVCVSTVNLISTCSSGVVIIEYISPLVISCCTFACIETKSDQIISCVGEFLCVSRKFISC